MHSHKTALFVIACLYFCSNFSNTLALAQVNGSPGARTAGSNNRDEIASRASIHTTDLQNSLFNQDTYLHQSLEQLRARQLFDYIGGSKSKDTFNNDQTRLITEIAKRPEIERMFMSDAFVGADLTSTMALALSATKLTTPKKALAILDNLEVEVLKRIAYNGNDENALGMHPDDIGDSPQLASLDDELRKNKPVHRPKSISSLAKIGGFQLQLLRLRLQVGPVKHLDQEIKRLAGDFVSLVSKFEKDQHANTLTIYGDELLEYLAELELVALSIGDTSTLETLQPVYRLLKADREAAWGNDMSQWRTDELHNWLFLDLLYESDPKSRQQTMMIVANKLLDYPDDFRGSVGAYGLKYFPGLAQVLTGTPVLRSVGRNLELPQAELRQVFSWINTCKYFQNYEETGQIRRVRQLCVPASARLTDPIKKVLGRSNYPNAFEAVFTSKWKSPSEAKVKEVVAGLSWIDLVQLQGMLNGIAIGNVQAKDNSQDRLFKWLDFAKTADGVHSELRELSNNVEFERRSSSFVGLLGGGAGRPPVTASALPKVGGSQQPILLLNFFRVPNPFPLLAKEPAYCGYYCISYDSKSNLFQLVRVGLESTINAWVDRLISSASASNSTSSKDSWPNDPVTSALKLMVKDATIEHRIQVMPDAALWRVPWASLPLEDNIFLIEHCEVSVESFWVRDRKSRDVALEQVAFVGACNYDLPLKRVKAEEVEAFGTEMNPRISVDVPQSLPIPKVASLEFSENERIAFQRIFGGTDCVVQDLSGDNAIEARVWQIRSPQLLFFSTHGFFIPSENLSGKGLDQYAGGMLGDELDRCGLLLSGANEFPNYPRGCDGILTGKEISMMDLSATRCVVLSACDSTIGDNKIDFSVRGLRKAFEIAGAKSIVSTLWQVDDQSTADLMENFLSRYASSQDPAKSLRHAQIMQLKKLRDRYGSAPPYLWAGFISTN